MAYYKMCNQSLVVMGRILLIQHLNDLEIYLSLYTIEINLDLL
jgi:hypothetical protein